MSRDARFPPSRLPSGVSELLKQWTDLALMVLTAEQHLKIAMLYECAAADRLGVPPQQRAAFARKAKWFRMKARIRAKTEAAPGPKRIAKPNIAPGRLPTHASGTAQRIQAPSTPRRRQSPPIVPLPNG